MKAEIKEWFAYKLAKELELPHLFHLDIFCGVKQTEKAVYAIFYTGYNGAGTRANHRAHWIPKSCIENVENLKMIEDYDEAIAEFDMEYAM